MLGPTRFVIEFHRSVYFFAHFSMLSLSLKVQASFFLMISIHVKLCCNFCLANTVFLKNTFALLSTNTYRKWDPRWRSTEADGGTSGKSEINETW